MMEAANLTGNSKFKKLKFFMIKHMIISRSLGNYEIFNNGYYQQRINIHYFNSRCLRLE